MKNTIWRSVISIMLCLALIGLVGCESKETSSKDSTGSKPNKNNNNITSQTETVVNPLTQGDISVGLNVNSVIPRDDDGEILPKNGMPVMLSAKTGFLDAEADAMRQKILNTGNTEKYYNITGTKYYISPGGDDANSGKSPKEALRTVEGLTNIDLMPGDAVLFERDSVFRFTSTFNTKQGVIYGSYGEGAKPKIYGSAQNFAQVQWAPSNRKNIWRTIYIYDAVGTIIFNHGEEVGCRRSSVRNLSANGQFFFNDEDGYMYLYCDKGNPAAIYDSIEISADVKLFQVPTGVGDVVVDNLCLKYSSSLAVSGKYNCGKITVTNCEFGYNGGYMRSGTSRLGNAIQAWDGVDGFIVKNNWIYQTFDTAITWQGMSGAKIKYMDIQIEDNLLEYNHTDIEFWGAESTLGDFAIKNNLFRFTQLGWGCRNDDSGLRGFDGVFYGTTSDMNVVGKMTVKNNIIDSPGGKIIKWVTNTGDWDKYFDVSGTKIYITEKYRFTTQITRLTRGNTDNEDNLYATNKNELLDAYKRIDPTVTVEWK